MEIKYKNPTSGREVEYFKIGFSPRKTNLTLHLILDMKKHAATLEKLGKHKTGSGCLYVNKLGDVDNKGFGRIDLYSSGNKVKGFFSLCP